MIDDSLAGNAVPAIEAISRVNIVRRKQLLHNNLQTRVWQSRNDAYLAESTAAQQEILRRVKRLLEMVSPMSDPQGRVALMLCESLFHLLVEEGVITKAKAMEAIEGVAELTREMAKAGNPPIPSSIETDLVEAIAKSFALKDNP